MVIGIVYVFIICFLLFLLVCFCEFVMFVRHIDRYRNKREGYLNNSYVVGMYVQCLPEAEIVFVHTLTPDCNANGGVDGIEL